jgi:hypothetical protein
MESRKCILSHDKYFLHDLAKCKGVFGVYGDQILYVDTQYAYNNEYTVYCVYEQSQIRIFSQTYSSQKVMRYTWLAFSFGVFVALESLMQPVLYSRELWALHELLLKNSLQATANTEPQATR